MRRIRRWMLAFAVLFVYQIAPDCVSVNAQTAALQLSVGAHLIQSEVAVTEAEKRLGLMNRDRLGANKGMLFYYGQPTNICMWMKNTRIPLSVAFIDAQGIIINIEDMKPMTLKSHCAGKPARFALEMNRGWFAKRNIRPGDMVKGLPKK
jgi:uncharacterized protein